MMINKKSYQDHLQLVGCSRRQTHRPLVYSKFFKISIIRYIKPGISFYLALTLCFLSGVTSVLSSWYIQR
jgi:hypothetical protein